MYFTVHSSPFAHLVEGMLINGCEECSSMKAGNIYLLPLTVQGH